MRYEINMLPREVNVKCFINRVDCKQSLFWSKICKPEYLGTDRLLRPWRGGGGYNFLRGLILGVNFENAQNVRGVKILRHRTGILQKSWQTILWLKQTHVFLKSRQTNSFRRFFVSNKMLPQNLAQEPISYFDSTTRNEAYMYAHTPIHSAENWKNIPGV